MVSEIAIPKQKTDMRLPKVYIRIFYVENVAKL